MTLSIPMDEIEKICVNLCNLWFIFQHRLLGFSQIKK